MLRNSDLQSSSCFKSKELEGVQRSLAERWLILHFALRILLSTCASV